MKKVIAISMNFTAALPAISCSINKLQSLKMTGENNSHLLILHAFWRKLHQQFATKYKVLALQVYNIANLKP
jgi:hypothetical protein